jgi:hypothetical protein
VFTIAADTEVEVHVIWSLGENGGLQKVFQLGDLGVDGKQTTGSLGFSGPWDRGSGCGPLAVKRG